MSAREPNIQILAQVMIAKTRHDAMEYTIISVDSYPTMVLNGSEPTGMWNKKDTDVPPDGECNTHRIGDALARSIRNMITDTIPEERKKPAKIDEAMKDHIEKTLDIKYDDLTKGVDTPYMATRWSDGTKTQPSQKNIKAGSKPTLLDRELFLLKSTLNEQGKDEAKGSNSDDKSSSNNNWATRRHTRQQ